MKKKVFVVPSVHWDREWYDNFQKFRYRLVRFIDDLLDTLKDNPDYKYFYFDGQTIPFADYLEIRPERREKICQYIKEGRIVAGPWYVMPDEFLISGEALVRNLKTGVDFFRELGGETCQNGYACDVFGHNSQMPQIFKNFGMKTATVYRGIGDYKKDLFVWQGADGTQIKAIKLDNDTTYSTFFFLMRWDYARKTETWRFRMMPDEDYVKQWKGYVERNQDRFTNNNIMVIDGCDHMDIEPLLSQILAKMNNYFDDYEFVLSSMQDYVEAVTVENVPLDMIEGPLYTVGYSGMNNNTIKNVLSSAVELKQANAKAETFLTMIAEPIDYYTEILGLNETDRFYRNVSPRDQFLKKAWNFVFENQPHDSICGCSTSEVHEDNAYRFRQAQQLAELVAEDGRTSIHKAIKTTGKGKTASVVIHNPSDVEIDGVTLFEFAQDWDKIGDDPNLRFYDEEGNEIPYVVVGRSKDVRKYHPMRRIIDVLNYTVLTIAAPLKIKARGWQILTYDDCRNKRTFSDGRFGFDEWYESRRPTGSLFTGSKTLDNGKLIVEINGDGTLNITNKESGKRYENMLFFEDGGDCGDGWAYQKPRSDAIVTPDYARVEILADSFLATRIKIVSRLSLPYCCTAEKRTGNIVGYELETVIDIVKDSYKIDFKTSVKNNAVGHRLRVNFPTYMENDTYKTLLPFDLHQWKITSDDGKTQEPETGFAPCGGIATFGENGKGFALYTKGLYEVGVKARTDKTAFLTLVRSTQKQYGDYRQGDPDWVYQAYENKRLSFEYALDFEADTDNGYVKKGMAYKAGLSCACEPCHDGCKLPPILTVEGDAVLSAFFRVENTLRIYDADKGCEGVIRFAKPVKKATEIRMDGTKVREVEIVNGTIPYTLKAKEIKTYSLEF